MWTGRLKPRCRIGERAAVAKLEPVARPGRGALDRAGEIAAVLARQRYFRRRLAITLLDDEVDGVMSRRPDPPVGAPIGSELDADWITPPGGPFGCSFVRHVAPSGAGIVRTAGQPATPRHGTRNAVANRARRVSGVSAWRRLGFRVEASVTLAERQQAPVVAPNASFLPRCGLRTDATQHTVGNSAKPCRAHCLLTRTTQADRHRMGPRPA